MSQYLEAAGVGLARHARRVQFGAKVSKGSIPGASGMTMPGDHKENNSDVDLEGVDFDYDI